LSEIRRHDHENRICDFRFSLLQLRDRLFGVECKRADAPTLTPSIRIGMADLGLHSVAVLYPCHRRYRLDKGVEAVPVRALAEVRPLFV
jgi:hypothetical protein